MLSRHLDYHVLFLCAAIMLLCSVLVIWFAAYILHSAFIAILPQGIIITKITGMARRRDIAFPIWLAVNECVVLALTGVYLLWAVAFHSIAA